MYESNHPIDLDRRFIPWSADEEPSDPDFLRETSPYGNVLDWKALLEKRRVVLLSEAGSGKTTEFKQQKRRLSVAGKDCFLVTLRSIGRLGFERALREQGWARFQAWRDSGEPAWLFLDSFDEAKQAEYRLVDVLQDVASAIDGVEGRVHIILSGRYSDWEFKHDLENLLECVPLPPPDRPVDTQSPNEALISVLNREKPEPLPEPEPPLIVVMAGMDKTRVEKFAKEKGVENAEKFLVELEGKNLWRLARRPIDLGWLVDYWRKNNKFGSFSSMLEASILERLKEPDTDRARTDSLDAEKSLLALERIGAALVFARVDPIRIPDGSINLVAHAPALALPEVLPDWHSSDLQLLIARPIFNVATAGYVKLHNDNQGEVRGYLTARWLHRLRTKGNCPWSRVKNLIFSDIYGEALVRPSMRSTTAWLSLWDNDVLREVLQREPQLLMEAGDPGSLPLNIRIEVLDVVLDRLVTGEHLNFLERDAVMRISRPDMGRFVIERWEEYHTSAPIRELLLQMVWLGRLEDCAGLALEAALAGHQDRYTRIFAGRAVVATGDGSQKRRYIDYLLRNLSTVSPIVIWDALENLFPEHFTVNDFLKCIGQIDPNPQDAWPGIDYYGPNLVARVLSRDDASAILRALLHILHVPYDFQDLGSGAADEVYFSTLESAATRLLDLSSSEETPSEAVHAVLRLGYSHRYRNPGHDGDGNNQDLLAMLRISPGRRRASFWHALTHARKTLSHDTKLQSIWQLQLFGYDPCLLVEDVPWIIDDITTKSDPLDVAFAVEAAMMVWKQNGEDSVLLARIKCAAETSSEGKQAFRTCFNSSKPSEAEKEFERRGRKLAEKRAIEIAERDQSWIEFAEKLRADPDQLRMIAPPTENGVDGRLYHLWRLLGQLGQNRSRHAIRDLSPLRPMFGDDVIDAFRESLIAYWRRWRPSPIWERKEEERNTISSLDMIGIAGITQEAEIDTNWAKNLSSGEAELAAIYATFELVGVPSWLDDLAVAHPDVVGNVLWNYAQVDLEMGEAETFPTALNKLSDASNASIGIVAERLMCWLEKNVEVPPSVIEPILRILRRTPSTRRRLVTLVRDLFLKASERNTRAVYFAALFVEDAEQAVVTLEAVLKEIDESEQTALVQTCLTTLYGKRQSEDPLAASSVPFSILKKLVILAFLKVHPRADNNRPSGQAYSPNERDEAERAREALFKALVDTPGLATFETLRHLRQEADFPVPALQLREFERARAEADSEMEPWGPQDVSKFEHNFESVPSTSQDLQNVGMIRLAEIEHHLLHGDFDQGCVVASLPQEIDVQNWFANELRNRQGRSYTLERSPHVAEEKEPDIRLSSRISDARCPIEFKIAEKWSLADLREALEDQLCGRYLRFHNSRFGILLLVHQKARPKGWEHDGKFLSFLEVVDNLRDLARDIGASDTLVPQPAVSAIDLSRISAHAIKSKNLGRK